MASVGAAAARGLETGLGMGLQLQANQQQQEDRRRRIDMELEDRQLARQDRERRLGLETEAKAARDRQTAAQEEDRALQALQSQIEALRAQGDAFAQQYGGQVPPDVAARYRAQVTELTGMRDDMLRGRYEPVLRRRQAQMADVLSQLQTDPAAAARIPDGDLFAALETALRRDPRELIGADGQPSRVDVAVADVMNGLQTGNEVMLLRGANVLLEPELRVGVGQESPHGGVILGKRVHAMVPHPQKPGEFTPMLRVYVGDGKIDTAEEQQRHAQIRQEDPDAPPGATGYYLAPVTENRSTDPADPVRSISVERAMDYAARMQTLAQLVSRNPDLRAKVERGAAAARSSGDDFLAAHFAIGGKMPAPKKISRERVDLGGEVLERTLDESGRITAEQRMPKTPAPSAKGLRGPGDGAGAGGGLAGPSASGASGATGEAALRGLSKEDADIVRGLANGSIVPDDISTTGNRRERMLALAKRFNPDADLTGRKRESEKPLPVKERQLLVEARTNASTISSLEKEFKDDFASKGILGMGTDLAIRAKSVLGTDTDTVQWWKNYRKMAELVERHAMFGAALTAAEQGSWRSADIDPGMDAEVIRRNLRTRATIAQKVLEATQQDLIDSGYNPERVQRIGGRNTDVPMDGRDPAGVTGSWDPPETNSKGWRLMVDGNGNRAYMSPDGKQFEEVR